MKNGFKKAVAVAGLVLGSTVAMAQFTPNMSFDAIVSEVRALQATGASATTIANAARGVLSESQAASLTTAMFIQGLDAGSVVQAVISAFGATDSVTVAVLGAARSAGVPSTVAGNAAILAGSNTNVVLGATAAGGTTNAGGATGAGDTGGLGGTGSFGAPRSSLISTSGGSTTTTSRSPS